MQSTRTENAEPLKKLVSGVRELLDANKTKEHEACYSFGNGKPVHFKKNCRTVLPAGNRTQEQQYHFKIQYSLATQHSNPDALVIHLVLLKDIMQFLTCSPGDLLPKIKVLIAICF